MCGDIRWSVVNLPEATSLKKTPSPSPIASQLEVGGGAHESPPPSHQNADWLGLEQTTTAAGFGAEVLSWSEDTVSLQPSLVLRVLRHL